MNASRAGSKGAAIPRLEDRRFLRGEGHFAADTDAAGSAHAALLRSPLAHARIVRIDTQSARSLPGVLGVFSQADLAADGAKPLPCLTRVEPFRLLNADGSEMVEAEQWPLATEKVRHVGDPVALVVAQSKALAEEAAELIEVRYEPLEAIVDREAALEPASPRVWDHLPSNQSFDYERGDAAAARAAFDHAAHVVRITLDNPRQIVAFLEPRGINAAYDPAEERFTVEIGCQAPHRLRDLLAAALGVAEDRVRVIAPDTGGGFGGRTRAYPEHVLAAWAARRLRRRVRWIAERSESFTTDTQARDQRTTGELALDAQGRFLGLRVDTLLRHGAYLPSGALWVVLAHMGPMICGAYRIPVAHWRARGVFSNTAGTAPFRGVARAEAAYLIERLVDAAARELGIDRIELRRRNLVAAKEMPWTTPVGAVYERTDIDRALRIALEEARWEDFEARRSDSLERGRLRGIGVATCIESTGGAPEDFAELVMQPDGRVRTYVGTKSSGMGHETAYAQVLADELGIGPDRIEIIDGDTALVRTGAGSHGSRSMRIMGNALVLAAGKLIDNAMHLAAEMLQADPGDLAYAEGRFLSTKSQALAFEEIAAHAERAGGSLSAQATYKIDGPVHPSGCQICEVEVDPETGAVTILAHVMVMDAGNAINPLIVHGQMQGAIAQGLGQAVLERVVYDPESGQLLSGSFADYALPRADDLPTIATLLDNTPSEDNPLGIKGAGESGTVGAPPAVMNAIVDALSRVGVTHIDMPATPERVWRAIAEARSRVARGCGTS